MTTVSASSYISVFVKNRLCSLILLFFPLSVFAKTDTVGIRFIENLTWNEVKAKAKAESKYIFIDAFATWCGPCKAMDAEIFPQALVGEMVNADFISVKVQMDESKNDNEFIKSWHNDAEEIARESQLSAYPTLLFYSPEGKLVHKAVGYKDADGLMQEAKKALDPSTQYFTLLALCEQGKLDTAAIKGLAEQARIMGDKEISLKVAQDYIKVIDKKDIYTKDNLAFIGRYLSGSSDPNFKIFFRNAKKVDSVMGRNFAEDLVSNIIGKEELPPYEKQDSVDWNTIRIAIALKYGKLGEERAWGHEMLYHYRRNDWVNFGKCYKEYYDRAMPNGRSFLHINNMSWKVFEHVMDKKILATAVKTMKWDIENFDGNDYAAIDTYANLLYKTGNKREALKWEKKAVQMSDSQKTYIDTFNKMKNNQQTWQN